MLEKKRIIIFKVKTACCLMVLLIAVPGLANEGKTLPLSAKQSVPINYYEWFMIGIGLAYTLYLVVRAKRRSKRKTAMEGVKDA